MRLELSSRAVRSYKNASMDVCRAFDKKITFLLADLRHPSLHAKKYDEEYGLWQARVNKAWRFYFLIINDTYIIVDITRHPK